MNYQQISLDLLAALAKIATSSLEDKFEVRRLLASALREANFFFPEEAAIEVIPLTEPLNMVDVQGVATVIAQGSADINVRFGDLINRKMNRI